MMLGPLIVGIKGTALSDSEKILLQAPLIGGVILFARNYSDKSQLRALVAEIKALRNPPLWVAVDQEGGRVQRFIHDFTRIPDMGQLGLLYQQDPVAALAQTEQWGFTMAQELLAVGVDMSFAPVVDLNKEKAKVIGNRSFHREPKVVVVLAEAWCRGVHRAGMKTCGKHFPGHGEVTVDSHEGLPVDVRDYGDIAADDLVPFQQLVQAGALDSIMPAHIIFPKVDDTPTGFSKIWLNNILRKDCGFKGVVISDDLGMGGAAGMGDYPERFEKALECGCDLALLCNDHPGIAELVAKTPVQASYDRSAQIAALYGNNVTVDSDPNVEKCEQAAPHMGFSR